MIAPARPSPTLSVELVLLDDLRPDPANPRRIDPDELDALERSLREFGFVQPVLARRDDGVVISGHQRLVAARRLGLYNVPVAWLDLGVEEARLLGLALNRIGGSFDEVLLARLLEDLQASPELDLTLAGFDDDEVRDLLRSLDTRQKRERVESFDLDEALDAVRQATRSKPGDLWQLGDHRLLCGDATDPAAVTRLLDGAAPTLLATDPPYGVSLDASWRDELSRSLDPDAPSGRGAGHRNTTIAGDTRVDWSEAYALVPSLEVGYVWHADRFAPEVAVRSTPSTSMWPWPAGNASAGSRRCWPMAEWRWSGRPERDCDLIDDRAAVDWRFGQLLAGPRGCRQMLMPAIPDVIEHPLKRVDAVPIQGHLKALLDKLDDDHVRSSLSYRLAAATRLPGHRQTIPPHDHEIVGNHLEQRHPMLGYVQVVVEGRQWVTAKQALRPNG